MTEATQGSAAGRGDTIRPNGTIVSDRSCPHEGCEKVGRHWHQHYEDHSPWAFGQGCPTHLHRYEAGAQ